MMKTPAEARILIESVEQCLRECKEKDARLFRIWAEYYVALQIVKRNPTQIIIVSPTLTRDIACHRNENDKKPIVVEVKTGKMDVWNNGAPTLNSADATFTKYQVSHETSFQYMVFLVHENYELIRTFVFARDHLDEEVLKHPRSGNRASDFYISYAKSLDELENWNAYYKLPTFSIEKMLIEKPDLFLDKWETIRL
jgi:hypothetical protein